MVFGTEVGEEEIEVCESKCVVFRLVRLGLESGDVCFEIRQESKDCLRFELIEMSATADH